MLGIKMFYISYVCVCVFFFGGGGGRGQHFLLTNVFTILSYLRQLYFFSVFDEQTSANFSYFVWVGGIQNSNFHFIFLPNGSNVVSMPNFSFLEGVILTCPGRLRRLCVGGCVR